MKKLVILFVLCFITGIATVNAAYQRKYKQPNFFIPAGSYQNTRQKSAPTQQLLQQRNRIFGISEDMWPQTTYSKTNTDNKKQETLARPNSLTDKIENSSENQEKNTEISPLSVSENKEETRPKTDRAKNSAKDSTNQKNIAPPSPLISENKKEIPTETNIQKSQISLPKRNITEKKQAPKTVSDKEPVSSQLPPNSPVLKTDFQSADEAYDEYKKEYKRDLQDIAYGLSVQNPRLSEMMKDFKDEEHTIHAPAL